MLITFFDPFVSHLNIIMFINCPNVLQQANFLQSVVWWDLTSKCGCLIVTVCVNLPIERSAHWDMAWLWCRKETYNLWFSKLTSKLSLIVLKFKLLNTENYTSNLLGPCASLTLDNIVIYKFRGISKFSKISSAEVLICLKWTSDTSLNGQKIKDQA